MPNLSDRFASSPATDTLTIRTLNDFPDPFASNRLPCGILFSVADKTKASFIGPMLLVRTDKLPEGEDWLYELKLDGFRSIAFKTGGKVQLRSRNDNDFNGSYPGIVKALAGMPDETVIDGEVVALDETGRPSFSALQNYGSDDIPIVYYVFDVMVLDGVDVMRELLSRRRELLEQKILPEVVEPSNIAPNWILILLI